MKLTKTALLKKTPDLFDTPDNVYREFQDYYEREKSELPSNLVLLYADYTYEDYSGDAYVLGYDKEKKQFFEVHGSHCSCYGLEGQWMEESKRGPCIEWQTQMMYNAATKTMMPAKFCVQRGEWED